MKKNSEEKALVTLKQYLVANDYDFHQSTGANRTIIGVIGDTARLKEEEIKAMEGVHQVVRIIPED
jgi:hypothetical protein